MSSACCSCLNPKAPLQCSACHNDVCKSCALFVDENTYPYLALFEKKIPEGVFCPSCFQNSLQKDLEVYEALVEKARNVEVFYRRTHGKETRLMKRIEPLIRIEKAQDEDEILMKLAFVAVQKQATHVIDIEVFSEKIKEGSYSLVTWRGSGYPATK